MAERAFIQVEADEQINGLIGRLRQSGAREVVFAVPEETAVLRNPVNLRLLRFYADEEHKSVRVVTGDSVVQRLADEAGVDWEAPVAQTVRPRVGEPPAMSAVRTQGLRRKPWQFRPRPVHLLAVPLLVLAVGGWQLLAGPAVTVLVSPAVSQRVSEVSLRGRVNGRTGVGEVPLTPVQKPVEATATVPATGRRRFGISAARGSVTFLNQNTQAVKVPAGTVVTTAAGTAFRTLETVSVPGVKAEYFMKIAVGLRSGQAEARVEALAPGSQGNVTAGRVVKLKSPISVKVQVTNPEPLRGGEDRTVTIVTSADLGRAERAAAAQLPKRAAAAVEDQLGAGLRVVPGSLRQSPPEIVPGQHADDEGTEATAKASVTAFALVYQPSAVDKAAREVWRRNLPAGLVAVPGSLRVSPAAFPRVEPQLAEVTITVTGQVAAVPNREAIRRVTRGKSVAAAEEAARSLPGVAGVTIKGARGRVPSWSSRVRVTVADPGEGAL